MIFCFIPRLLYPAAPGLSWTELDCAGLRRTDPTDPTGARPQHRHFIATTPSPASSHPFASTSHLSFGPLTTFTTFTILSRLARFLPASCPSLFVTGVTCQQPLYTSPREQRTENLRILFTRIYAPDRLSTRRSFKDGD